MAKFIRYLYEYGDQSCSLVVGDSVTRGRITMPIFDSGLAGSSLVWILRVLFNSMAETFSKINFSTFFKLGFFFVDKNKIGLKAHECS